MDAAALGSFTPVALNLGPPAPTLDWGDLGTRPFSDPFFDATVERWAAGPAPRLIRTDLATLAALDSGAARDPDALVFHMSRCGSTLVSRLLATVPEARVIVEPMPLNTLLMAEEAELGGADRVELLRLLLRALGRSPSGPASFYALKASSWNVAWLPLFRRAFPTTPCVFVRRAPAEVIASILADPPAWLALRSEPSRAARLFALAANELTGLDAAAFSARALMAMLQAAASPGEGMLVVDYRQLPDAVWLRMAPHIGLRLAESDIARMRAEARFSAKASERRLFADDGATKQAAAGSVASLAQAVEPYYRALG
ncbi:MAG TPA: hypothetical protein VLX85_07175 [Stellaceae bacterium]|nr:hypothetical protein [Stellaceae bacterium]